MNPLNCHQVLDEVELFAAGECDAATREAIEEHVAGCPGCAAALEQSRQVIGWVSLNVREPQALERLQKRLRAEARQRRVPRGLFVLRAGAVAAVLLLTAGLYLWMGQFRDHGRPEQTVAAAHIGAGQDAVYLVQNAQEMKVERGAVLIRIAPGRREAKPFHVHTSAGTATAESAEFVVDVGAAAPVSVRVLSGKVTLSNDLGQLEARRGETVVSSAKAAPTRLVEDLALRFSRSYVPVKVKTPAGVPAFQLPVDLSEVAHLPTLPKGPGTLRTQGFAVLANAPGDDLLSSYQALRDQGMSVMVTSDMVLHLVRLHLAQLLADLEEHQLALYLARLTAGLRAKVAELKLPAEQADAWQAARTRALTYLAVGERLIDAEAESPAGIDPAAVETIARAIEAGQALKEVPGFGYAVDFAEFRPAGHYSGSETLKRYYRARMWFGRAPLPLAGNGLPVSDVNAQLQTMAAALIVMALRQTTLADGRSAAAVWQRLDAVSSFFGGAADQPGPLQYGAALQASSRLAALAERAGWERYRRELLQYMPRPMFADATRARVPPGVPEDLAGAQSDAGFRLLSQRFAADAFALGKLVYPNLGPGSNPKAFTALALPDGKIVRGLPRGLDLMALLGNSFARRVLHDSGDDAYAGSTSALSYEAAFDRLQADFGRLDTVEWNRDLYWAWLYVLQVQLREPPSGSPTFMTSGTYHLMQLNTALASWTELRDDMVLYTPRTASAFETAKALKFKDDMAVAPNRGLEAQAYLEPLPELYARLLALTRMAATELDSLAVLTAESRQRLSELEKLLMTMLTLAEKELDDERLSAAEQDTLRRLPERQRQLTGSVVTAPVIVTVAADATGRWVLQEATGRPDLALFVVRLPGGKLVTFAGPVMSYYEFKQPRAEALTQERWLERLQRTPGPARPEWNR